MTNTTHELGSDLRAGERFVSFSAATPTGGWAYIVDDCGIEFGAGWFPFRRERGGQPALVRLSPDTDYCAWSNEYVQLMPAQDSPRRATAIIHVFKRAQGMGAIVSRASVTIDIPSRTIEVSCEDPEAIAGARDKANRLLAFVLASRDQRRRGLRRPATAHERYQEHTAAEQQRDATM